MSAAEAGFWGGRLVSFCDLSGSFGFLFGSFPILFRFVLVRFGLNLLFTVLVRKMVPGT